MAGTFIPGEQKIRPGSYFNVQKSGGNIKPNTLDGVTAVVFRADTGPLGTAVEIACNEDYTGIFGTGLTTDAIREAIAGGARTVIACRVGKGGTPGTVTLKDADGADAVVITAVYPGDKEFTITLREMLSDPDVKECIIYDGTAEYERIKFTAAGNEAQEFVKAVEASGKFTAALAEGKESASLAAVSQAAFTKGSNPTVTAEDYSDAFAQVEPYVFNTICVDTEDSAVHLLLQAFLDRIFDAASPAQAVVAEKHTVPLAERQEHAAAFNDERMIYVLNAHVEEQGKEIDGYQTAARIAGMVGSTSSAVSLTHTVMEGYTDILEKLTNTEIIAAEKSGCLVFSFNKARQVWIDNAINTLVKPAENQDDGWKKIRRVKTRYELIRRINEIVDGLAGKVDNDSNGRSTVISQVQGIGDTMIEEGKLVFFSVTEVSDAAYVDSAYFDLDVIDKDSMEHIYMTFRFQFAISKE